MTSKTHINHSVIYISAALNISCAAADIEVKADGKCIYVCFPSIRSAFSAYKLLRSQGISADFLTLVNKTLQTVEITVFIQNRHFAILGAKANPLLLNLFMRLRKPADLLR